jgi:hypothetical protein
MDNERFDALSRRIAAGGTRRRALGTIGALALGAAGLGTGLDDVAARPAICRPGGRYCTHGKQCCSTRCRTGKRVPIASRNICECAAPTTLCGRACRDLASDPNNCGACGDRIDPTTHLCCEGEPTPIGNDNCGACGNACPDGVDCIDNMCGLPPATTCETIDPYYYCFVTVEGRVSNTTCYKSQFDPNSPQGYPCDTDADCYQVVPACQSAPDPYQCACMKVMDGDDLTYSQCYFFVDDWTAPCPPLG